MIELDKNIDGIGTMSIRARYLLYRGMLQHSKINKTKEVIKLSPEAISTTKAFERGYYLKDLDQTLNYQQLFDKEGIHYVNGLLKRFSKKTDNIFEPGMLEVISMQIGIHPKKKAYKEAIEFKKNFKK